MTPTLARLIVIPDAKQTGRNKKTGEPLKEQLNRRKFAVDLKKIGIEEGDEKGREVTDKVFEWDILKQK